MCGRRRVLASTNFIHQVREQINPALFISKSQTFTHSRGERRGLSIVICAWHSGSVSMEKQLARNFKKLVRGDSIRPTGGLSVEGTLHQHKEALRDMLSYGTWDPHCWGPRKRWRQLIECSGKICQD